MIILGSTGTIGVRSLEIAFRFNKQIEAISAGRNITLLNQQIAKYKPKKVAIACEADIDRVESNGAEVFVGASGICEMIKSCKSDFVLNGIVGFAGLLPSICTQKCGKKLALANKESLVAGGWLLDTNAITPIDSEHFGLWYLMRDSSNIKRLIITASGGAFRDVPLESIALATKEQALKHPNWQMGQKITIDSATMANKLFEALEAYWLFSCSEISAFIERSSSIHALVECIDGSTLAHFALPNMSLPIAYAIDKTQARENQILDSIDLVKLGFLKFEAIDTARYPLWGLKDTLIANPKLGVIINAANEVAVNKFLRDEIGFGKIANIVFSALEKFSDRLGDLLDYEHIEQLDKEVREAIR